MAYALMTSGGKDSMLALDRARQEGMDVRILATIYEGSTGRLRFHGVRHELIAAQAESLGLEYVAAATSPHPFEPVFEQILRDLKDRDIQGVVFGNVHLADVREWYEERVKAAGLEHIEPLWGGPGIEVAWGVVERGHRAVVVSVDLAQRAVPFLGREFDADLVTEIGTMEGIDPCGERGEYHTFVFDGPDFSEAVKFTRGETLEIDGHRFLDLLPAGA